MSLAWRAPLSAAAALLISASCAGDFDTKRRAPPPSTLGDDIYSALCDRLGAGALTEDLSGASYRGICHRDASGNYGNEVDQSPEALPPVSGAAAVTRQIAVAKLHALARRRADVIAALNFVFDDGSVEVPFSSGQTIRGHDALSQFLKKLVPLYESNPVEGTNDPKRGLMPDVTSAVGRMFAGLAGPLPGEGTAEDRQTSDRALEAMARIAGRQGYRPARVVLGAVRPALAYPGLRSLAQTLLPRVEPGGSMHDSLENVLGMMESELADSVAVPRPEIYVVDPVTAQPNRPRTKMEIGRALMLSSDPVFAAPGAAPRYLVQRDPRGVAIPLGNVPGVPGTVPATFLDANGDGLADVDAASRLLGLDSLPAAVDPPFVVPGLGRFVPADPFGRALDPGGQPVYEYVNTSESLVASLLRDLEPLLDPDPTAQHETVTDLLSGAFVLYGDLLARPAPWAVGGEYTSFDASTSPLVDLLHAVGQLFAHPASDSWIAGFTQLMRDNEQDVARFLGAALKLREISNARPDIALDPRVTFWDELTDVLVKILRKNSQLFKDVLRSFKHPDAVAYLPGAIRSYAQFRDKLSYDPANLGGPPINLTTGAGPVDPSTPVDRSQPDVGDNRSELHQFLQIVHDVNGVNACNKQGARVSVVIDLPILPPLDLVWPIPPLSGYDECELFVFENMGLVFVDAILGKAQVEIRDNLLDSLVNGPLGGLLDANQLFEESSGIPGMTLSPTAQGLARLAFFGAESPLYDPLFNGVMPDRDPFWNGPNDKTNRFVRNLVEPVSTSVCPTRPAPGLPGIELADCALPGGNPFDVLRIRDQGVLFTWEKYQFYDGIRPLLAALDAHDSAELFLELNEVIYRHYPTLQPTAVRPDTECNTIGTWKKSLDGVNPLPRCPGGDPCYNSRYCSGSGLSSYEPIIIDAMATDLIPALANLIDVMEKTVVVDNRQNPPVTKNGLDIAYELSVALFDPAYAAGVGMKDRAGNAGTTLADEVTPKPQLTPFDLFAKALRAIDVRLEGNPRLERWRRARSQLVDTFLAIDGEGPNAKFRNPATPRAAPILFDALRQQINANCPNRETSGVPCQWATVDFAAKAAATIEEPTFSTSMVLLDLINQDEEVRRELERFLRYLVQQASDNDALHSTLTSLSDLLQLLNNDEVMPPIYNAISVVAAPETSTTNGKATPGAGDRVVQLLAALTKEDGKPNAYDPYRIVDRILRNLVTPMNAEDPDSVTPLEILLDTLAEVNRADASLPPDEPLTAEDYRFVFATVRDFMGSKTRGMEQFYEIVRNRDGK